jgi:hypothetical protein
MMFRYERLRFRFARLVGEPVLVVRLRALADGRDQARQRQLVRITEREVAGSWIQPLPRVAGGQIETVDR